MGVFAPVTDADLARARGDAAFRRKLLEQNLETLLAAIRKAKDAAASRAPRAEQMREAVQLAVKLAELIQGPVQPRGKRLDRG